MMIQNFNVSPQHYTILYYFYKYRFPKATQKTVFLASFSYLPAKHIHKKQHSGKIASYLRIYDASVHIRVRILHFRISGSCVENRQIMPRDDITPRYRPNEPYRWKQISKKLNIPINNYFITLNMDNFYQNINDFLLVFKRGFIPVHHMISYNIHIIFLCCVRN